MPIAGQRSGDDPTRSIDGPGDAATHGSVAARSAAGWASLPTSGMPAIGSPGAGPGGRDAETLGDDVASLPAPRRSTTLDDAEEPRARAGRRAAPDSEEQRGDATDAKADGPKRPGDIEETLIAFWDDKAVERFQAEWHEVKADFVDDPVAALTRAHALITEAVNELTGALLAERDELDPLRTTSAPDTESMRMAMRGYRDFMDRILAL